jgi:hypothetical protein
MNSEQERGLPVRAEGDGDEGPLGDVTGGMTIASLPGIGS